MEARISVELTIHEKTYDIEMNIPSTIPTPQSPYLFIIAGTDKDKKKIPLLEVAIGNSSHYYVGVTPPNAVFEEAKIGHIVKQLEVVVSEGKYNKDAHKFSTETLPETPPKTPPNEQ